MVELARAESWTLDAIYRSWTGPTIHTVGVLVSGALGYFQART